MARRKKKKEAASGPAWLITFSDMMTLMLTFFVLLVSMAVIDERRKLVVISSISGAFGSGEGSFNPKSVKNQSRLIEPGAIDDMDTDSLEPLKDMLWEDQNGDLNFQENQFVQILSISDEVLFTPGTAELSHSGVVLMNRLLPWLLRIDHPLLLAGHTAGMREEMGQDYKVSMAAEKNLSPMWELSFLRVMGMYRYLTSRGVPPARLSVEGFGSNRPRWTELTAEGRRLNRRVDIVLDKRNREWIEKIEKLCEKEQQRPGEFNYKDFRFRVGVPQDAATKADE